MNYIAMRLLGVPMEDDRMKRAREFLAANDGCKGIPSWVHTLSLPFSFLFISLKRLQQGKFWLSVMGVYDWEGMHPIPPELWLLPYMLPFHPGRLPLVEISALGQSLTVHALC